MADNKYSLNQWIDLNIYDIDVDRICHEIKDDLFESAFFSHLREICLEYGFIVRLFFSQTDELEKLFLKNEIITSQIKNRSSWIKIGWLQQESGENKSDEEIASEINSFFAYGLNELGRDSMCISSIITERVPLDIENDFLLTGRHRFIIQSDNQLLENSLEDVNDYSTKGYFIKGKYEYRKADLVIDLSKSYEDNIAVLGNRVNDYPQKTRLIVTCRGEDLLDESDFLMNFFDIVHTLAKKIYINASIIVGRDLYFTAGNLKHLFKMKLDDQTIESALIIPCDNKFILKFSSIIWLDNSLWLIPWMGKDIYVYDCINLIVETIHIPSEVLGDESPRFRKAIYIDGSIFLIPRFGGYFLRIDPTKKTVAQYDISKYSYGNNSEESHGYEGIVPINEGILFFGDQYNRSLVFDIINNTFKDFNLKTNGGHVIPISDDRLMVIPTFCREGLKIFNMDKVLVKEIELPEDIWGNKVTEYFWYPKVIDDYVYILSIELGIVIRYGIEDETIKIIKWPDYPYEAMTLQKEFTGYDIHKVNEEIWVTSHIGNHILRIDIKGEVVGVINLKVPLYQLSTTGTFDQMFETKFYNLSVFLHKVRQIESSLQMKESETE